MKTSILGSVCILNVRPHVRGRACLNEFWRNQYLYRANSSCITWMTFSSSILFVRCVEIGIPLAPEKCELCEGPSTCLTYCSVGLRTWPPAKLKELVILVRTWVSKKWYRDKESVLGKLNNACVFVAHFCSGSAYQLYITCLKEWHNVENCQTLSSLQITLNSLQITLNSLQSTEPLISPLLGNTITGNGFVKPQFFCMSFFGFSLRGTRPPWL